jgi:hypothetical protein
MAATKDTARAYWALSLIPNLTGAQRTTLCDVLVGSKDQWLAYHTLYIRNLIGAQRSALQKIAQAA